MSIFEYNGAAIIGMAGKECVAIASDLRFGVQLQTMTTDRPKVYKVHDKLYVGLGGLATDAQTLYQRLIFRHNMYKLREERDMKPSVFGWLVSNMLYEKRFGPYFTGPLVVGLEPDNTPFLVSQVPFETYGAATLMQLYLLALTIDVGPSPLLFKLLLGGEQRCVQFGAGGSCSMHTLNTSTFLVEY